VILSIYYDCVSYIDAIFFYIENLALKDIKYVFFELNNLSGIFV